MSSPTPSRASLSMPRIIAAAVALGAIRAEDVADPAGPRAFATAAADLSDAEWKWFTANRRKNARVRMALTAGEIDAADGEFEPSDPLPISFPVAAQALGRAAARDDPYPRTVDLRLLQLD